MSEPPRTTPSATAASAAPSASTSQASSSTILPSAAARPTTPSRPSLRAVPGRARVSRSRSRFPVARARAVERGRRAARVPVHHEPPRRREPPAEDGAARGVEAAGVEAEAVERGEGLERGVEDLGPEARGAAEVERGRGRGARRGEEPADGRGAVRAEVRRVAEPELAEPRGRGRRRERVAGGREARAFEPVAGEVQRREARLGREGLGEAREARVAEAVARQVEVRERAAVAIEQRRREARGALGADVAGEPQGPQRQVPRRAEEAAREGRRARRADAAVDAERAPVAAVAVVVRRLRVAGLGDGRRAPPVRVAVDGVLDARARGLGEVVGLGPERPPGLGVRGVVGVVLVEEDVVPGLLAAAVLDVVRAAPRRRERVRQGLVQVLAELLEPGRAVHDRLRGRAARPRDIRAVDGALGVRRRPGDELRLRQAEREREAERRQVRRRAREGELLERRDGPRVAPVHAERERLEGRVRREGPRDVLDAEVLADLQREIARDKKCTRRRR